MRIQRFHFFICRVEEFQDQFVGVFVDAGRSVEAVGRVSAGGGRCGVAGRTEGLPALRLPGRGGLVAGQRTTSQNLYGRKELCT